MCLREALGWGHWPKHRAGGSLCKSNAGPIGFIRPAAWRRRCSKRGRTPGRGNVSPRCRARLRLAAKLGSPLFVLGVGEAKLFFLHIFFRGGLGPPQKGKGLISCFWLPSPAKETEQHLKQLDAWSASGAEVGAGAGGGGQMSAVSKPCDSRRRTRRGRWRPGG